MKVSPNGLFERRGDDLICEVPVTFAEAALGAEVTVPTKDGTATLKVPPGTQSGQVLRLAGMGVPRLREKGAGDQLVRVKVAVPKKLSRQQRELIESELHFQRDMAHSPAFAALPRGPIHADLFRDNVMFDGLPGHEKLTGFFDFYFAGVDTWLFDLAVCLNDWCIDLAQGAHDATRAASMLNAYQAERPLTAAERELLPAMLRAGALRFWISRLWDFYLPREASMLTPHDPTHFERVLRGRIARPVHA